MMMWWSKNQLIKSNDQIIWSKKSLLERKVLRPVLDSLFHQLISSSQIIMIPLHLLSFNMIFFSWVYSLINHKKKTLLSSFKDLINQCDRIKFNERTIIRIIRILIKKSSSIKNLKIECASKKLIEIDRRRILLNKTKNLNVLMNC
jgi:hypothetical protein